MHKKSVTDYFFYTTHTANCEWNIVLYYEFLTRPSFSTFLVLFSFTDFRGEHQCSLGAFSLAASQVCKGLRFLRMCLDTGGLID